MNYPNRVVKKGDTDKATVRTVQTKLNEKGCGPITVDGDFGDQTFRAVKLFQTRNSDAQGNVLAVDGEIGSITWASLFGTTSVANTTTAPVGLLAEALKVAVSQLGVVESPPFSNQGPEVDQYLKSTGLDSKKASYPWCAAFTYWSFNKAAQNLGRNNPLYKTAGCLEHWNQSKAAKITKAQAIQDPSLVKPGAIFIIDHGSGQGHTGIVESISGGNLTTIEGNTNNDGSRNGYGVLRLNSRKITQINKGFLDYSAL